MPARHSGVRDASVDLAAISSGAKAQPFFEIAVGLRNMQMRRIEKHGAQERTRTSTPLRELAPEASASANSATWALHAGTLQNHIDARSIICQRSTRQRRILDRKDGCA